MDSPVGVQTRGSQKLECIRCKERTRTAGMGAMTVAQTYAQLALPLADPTHGPPLRRALAPARTAVATADRHALAVHLAGVAQLRGRSPVPKPGQVRPSHSATKAARTTPGERAHSGRRRLVSTSTELGPVTMFQAFVRLISVDPAVNRFRVYVLSWHPTLWGDFALVQTWGRLGRPGRSRTTGYPSRAAAQGMIVRLLRRRLQHGYRVVTWT